MTTTQTRKQAHAEGVEFLRQTAELLDQAHSMFRDAGTENCIDVRIWGRYTSIESMSQSAMRMFENAKGLDCEDCNQVISECACKWANEAVR